MSGVMENNACVFMGHCDAALLRCKRELRMLGTLLNAYHCQTPFPESAWTDIAFDPATGAPTPGGYNMTAHSSSFEYFLSFEDKRAMITMIMPVFLFQILADQHEQVFAGSDWA